MTMTKGGFIAFCVIINVLFISHLLYANDDIIGYWKFSGDKAEEIKAKDLFAKTFEISEKDIIINNKSKISDLKSNFDKNSADYEGENISFKIILIDKNNIIVTPNKMPVSLHYTRMNDEEEQVFDRKYSKELSRHLMDMSAFENQQPTPVEF